MLRLRPPAHGVVLRYETVAQTYLFCALEGNDDYESKTPGQTTLTYRHLKPGVRFRVLDWPHLNPVEIVASKRKVFVVVEMDDPSPQVLHTNGHFGFARKLYAERVLSTYDRDQLSARADGQHMSPMPVPTATSWRMTRFAERS